MEEEFAEIEGYQVRTCPMEQSVGGLDLNQLLIANPEATFFLRFRGDSMRGAGVFDGDIVVVDRSLAAGYGNLVILWMNEVFKMRRLVRRGEGGWNCDEGPDYPLLEVDDWENLEVWGTVSSIIRKV